MKYLRRFVRWLQAPLFVGGYEPLRRPAYPVDRALQDRIKAARAKLPENAVKRLIEEQPDTFEKPSVDFPA